MANSFPPHCRFAPVAPISVLEAMNHDKCAGFYHLLLAHDVIPNQERFHKFFSHKDFQYAEVIMDNSVIELGEAVTVEFVSEAAFIIEQTGVAKVIPVMIDKQRDAEATIDLGMKFLDEWPGDTIDEDFMGVVQGPTLGDVCKCLEAYAMEECIRYIGIPRNLVETLDSREMPVHLTRAICPNKQIHLLGFSSNLIDDVLCSRMEGVGGIDSAVPVRLGMQDKLLSLATPNHSPRGDWWDNPGNVDSLNKKVLTNMANIRKWIWRK